MNDVESIAFTVDVDGRHAVLLSREEYNKVISDEAYKEKILQNLRAALGTAENQDQLSPEKENDTEVSKTSIISTAMAAPRWTHEGILYLIEEYRQEKDKHQMVKDVWMAISKSLATKGYDISASECDKKWRNLKSTYKKCIEVKERTGRGPQKWTYFDLFDEIYRQDKSRSPQDVINSAVASFCSVEDIASTSQQTSGMQSESQSDDSDLNEDDEMSDGNENGNVKRKIKRKRKDFNVMGPKWSHELILHLIEEFRKEKGRHDKVKDIWSAVSASLALKGYDIVATECDKKWRNLKITYKKIKELKERTGLDSHKWLYYDLFDQIFQDGTESLENGTSILHGAKWSHNIILLLIEEFRKEKDNHRMVKNIWTAVSKNLASRGVDIAPAECDKKWRNLKSTFVKIKDMKLRTGKGPIKWPYYDFFQELYPDMETTEQAASVLEVFLSGGDDITESIIPSTSNQIGSGDAETAGTIFNLTGAAGTTICRSVLKRKSDLSPPPWWTKVSSDQRKIDAERDVKLLTEIRLLRETIARTFGATNAMLKEIIKKM